MHEGRGAGARLESRLVGVVTPTMLFALFRSLYFVPHVEGNILRKCNWGHDLIEFILETSIGYDVKGARVGPGELGGQPGGYCG